MAKKAAKQQKKGKKAQQSKHGGQGKRGRPRKDPSSKQQSSERGSQGQPKPRNCQRDAAYMSEIPEEIMNYYERNHGKTAWPLVAEKKLLELAGPHKEAASGVMGRDSLQGVAEKVMRHMKEELRCPLEENYYNDHKCSLKLDNLKRNAKRVLAENVKGGRTGEPVTVETWYNIQACEEQAKWMGVYVKVFCDNRSCVPMPSTEAGLQCCRRQSQDASLFFGEQEEAEANHGLRDEGEAVSPPPAKKRSHRKPASSTSNSLADQQFLHVLMSQEKDRTLSFAHVVESMDARAEERSQRSRQQDQEHSQRMMQSMMLFQQQLLQSQQEFLARVMGGSGASPAPSMVPVSMGPHWGRSMGGMQPPSTSQLGGQAMQQANLGPPFM